MFLNQTILRGAPHFVKNMELQSFSLNWLVEIEFVLIKFPLPIAGTIFFGPRTKDFSRLQVQNVLVLV